MSLNGIQLVHVAAMNENRCIGSYNKLPWHVPEDMRHFFEVTKDAFVVMGRKTFDSLPKLLTGRKHWVLSRTLVMSEGVEVRMDLHQLLADVTRAAKSAGKTEVFIIGGGELYEQTMEWVDRLELTIIRQPVTQGADTYYPSAPMRWHQHNPWVLAERSPVKVSTLSGIEYFFATYRKYTETTPALDLPITYDSNARRPAPGAGWRHYKGTLYRVVGTFPHTETGEALVAYVEVGDPKKHWVTPLSRFFGKIITPDLHVDRFTYDASGDTLEYSESTD